MNITHRCFELGQQIRVDWRKAGYLALGIGTSVIMAVSNDTLFHTVAEGFNIILAALIYVLAVKTFRYSRSNPLLFLGYSYFFIGSFNLLHLLADSRLEIFPGIGNAASNLLNGCEFIFQAAALFLVPLFTARRFSRRMTSGILAAIGLILIFGSFLVYGLPYTVQIKSLIISAKGFNILLLIAAGVHLYVKRRFFNSRIYGHIQATIIFTLIAAGCGLFFEGTGWWLNWLGHSAKIMATLRIYQLIITFGIEAPYDLIFKELKNNVVLDALTGIYNRNGLIEFVKKELARGRKEDSAIGLLLIDIDNFKKVNDRHGHLVGDAVLKSFAAILKTSVRENDIICRLGGDEFVILIKGDREILELVRWRIREAFQSWQQTDQMARKIGISIGAAIWESQEQLNIERLLKEADLSMYNEKTRKKSNKKTQDILQLTMFGSDLD